MSAIFAHKLYAEYESFKEQSLSYRRFKHKDIERLILNKSQKLFEIKKAGESYEKRGICIIKAGSGEKKILLWSQMHGNEPTATQALFDIFNLLEKPSNFEEEISLILQQCSLYFIPMLNPDGSERFIRRNAQGIDINRDALKTEAPESKLLMSIRDELKPEFGFNLHDQDIWYAAGNTSKPASISFLTPSFNEAKDIDDKRINSMQVIASMTEMLNDFIPGHIARYNDDFMPTAFGDNIQKRGTSTILIESGGSKNDPEKQFIRKLNAVAILHALHEISTENYKKTNYQHYFKIPLNVKNKLFDFIIRDVRFTGPSGNYTADIGIRSIPEPLADRYEISDMGDLSPYYAFDEVNAGKKEVPICSLGDDALPLIRKYFPDAHLQ